MPAMRRDPRRMLRAHARNREGGVPRARGRAQAISGSGGDGGGARVAMQTLPCAGCVPRARREIARAGVARVPSSTRCAPRDAHDPRSNANLAAGAALASQPPRVAKPFPPARWRDRRVMKLFRVVLIRRRRAVHRTSKRAVERSVERGTVR
eukprot:357510-Chlamydomonas_euryale.AAC.5